MRFTEFDIPLERGGPVLVEVIKSAPIEIDTLTDSAFALPEVGTIVDRTELQIFCDAARKVNEYFGEPDCVSIAPNPNDVNVYIPDEHDPKKSKIDGSRRKIIIAGTWPERNNSVIQMFWDEVFAIRQEEQIS